MLIEELEFHFDKLKQGLIDESVEKIKEICTSPQVADDLRYEVAIYFYQLGFLDEAIQLVEYLYKRYPHENELLLFLAELYMEYGREDDALSLLVMIKPEEKEFVQATLLKADLYLLQGLHEVAEYKLKEALEHYPDKKILFTALGEIFYLNQNYQAALLHFQRGEKQSEAKLADCYAHLGQFEEALPLYEQALHNSEEPNLLFAHGFVATQLAKWETASFSFQKLIDLDPYYTTAYPLLVEAYLHLGQEEEALASVEIGLMYDQTNPRLFYLKGEILLSQGKKQEAKDLFSRSLEQDESYVLALERLLHLTQEEEDWPEALSLVQKMLEHQLGNADLYVQQAHIFVELEEWLKAEESYREALQINGDKVDALNGLASLLWEEGKSAEALSLWHKSLKIEPEQWELSTWLEQLE